MITGTIRSAVNMQVMTGKWEQKKQDIVRGKDKAEMTPEERQLQIYQEQADEIRESRKPAGIDAKLASGAKLTPEEIEYLRKNSPETLKEYEEIQRERENYKKQLRNCKSKEEVERLKMSKMGQYLSACKQISTNPNIPKGKKLELLQKLQGQVAGVEKEHLAFEQSLQFARLPEEDEEAGKKAKEKAEENIEQSGVNSIAEEPVMEEGEESPVSNGTKQKTALNAEQGSTGENHTAEQVKMEIQAAIARNADPANETGTVVDIKAGSGADRHSVGVSSGFDIQV